MKYIVTKCSLNDDNLLFLFPTEVLDSMNEVVIEGYLDSPREEYGKVRKFILDSFNNVEEIKWDFIENSYAFFGFSLIL